MQCHATPGSTRQRRRCAWFTKPHTAFDPPRPFDARYDPRQMPDPVGSVELLAERGLTAFASRPAEYEWNEFSPEAMRTIKAHYYGLVTFQDLQVGRLLDLPGGARTARGHPGGVHRGSRRDAGRLRASTSKRASTKARHGCR